MWLLARRYWLNKKLLTLSKKLLTLSKKLLTQQEGADLARSYWLLARRYWLLKLSCWPLARSCWLLERSCWLLARRYWLNKKLLTLSKKALTVKNKLLTVSKKLLTLRTSVVPPSLGWRRSRRVDLDRLNLKMETLHWFETSATSYQPIGRNMTEDLNPRPYRSGTSSRLMNYGANLEEPNALKCKSKFWYEPAVWIIRDTLTRRECRWS